MTTDPLPRPPSITHATGAWLIHIILILAGKLLFDLIPGVTQEISWTMTNIAYMVVSLHFPHTPAAPYHLCTLAYLITALILDVPPRYGYPIPSRHARWRL